MNNTKANVLQNAHFLKISVPGLICAIKIWETALYILEGSIESNYSKETAKNEQKFHSYIYRNYKPNVSYSETTISVEISLQNTELSLEKLAR